MHIVQCRICKKKFDTDVETDWIKPVTNMYYHKSCYEDFGKKKDAIHSELDKDLWEQLLWDYLVYDMKISLNYTKVKKQWEAYIKEGFTPKGIFFTLKYFYGVQRGDPSKSKEGIGIVPYIYNESCEYWISREREDSGICARIEEQMRKNNEQRKVTVLQKRPSRSKSKPQITFDELARIINEEDGT